MYTYDRFQKLVNEFREREERILNWKANEYAKGEDRLQNFREIAAFCANTDAADVALMHLLKHIQAIKHQIETREFSWVWETGAGEGLKQRICDARNYLLLLAACIDEFVEHAGISDSVDDSTAAKNVLRELRGA